MKTILVTGGAGFIGSNFILMLLSKSNYKVINVDTLTYAGNVDNLRKIENHPQYIFHKCNVVDREAISEIFNRENIDYVVHFAAESHVDRSILNPSLFIETNVLGTQVLLDVAKEAWKINKSDKYCNKYREATKFIQVSTDEVYGSLGPEGLFTEETPLSPNSPYSASKASADLLAKAYFETYGFPVVITRCSNNYGPFQFPEKLIPLMIYNALNDKELPIYGDGLQVRDWLYVEDHCHAILKVLECGKIGDVYNVGGLNEKTNLEIVKLILSLLNKPETLIKFVKDRPGHDRRYAIDNSKIQKDLEWLPEYRFEEGMKKTVAWYLQHIDWLENIISGEYLNYYQRMYGEN